MHAILKPFDRLLNPGPYQVPTGRLQIDWLHPLSRSLIGCWLPGVMGGVDVSNQVPTLTTKIRATDGSTIEGASLISANASGDCGFVGLATPPFKTWTEFTLHWRGSVLGQVLGGANPNICGITYGDTGAAPYIVLSLNPRVTTGYPGISIFRNNAGSFQGAAFENIINSYNIIYSLTASVLVSAAASSYLYVNGSQAGTFAFGTAPNTSATSSIVIGTDSFTIGRSANISTNLMCCWNRQLTANEIKDLDQNPNQFLLPAEYEMPALSSLAHYWQLYFSKNSGAYEPVTTTSIGVKSADASTDADETKILIPRL